MTWEQTASLEKEEHDHAGTAKRVTITGPSHIGSVSIFGTVQSTPGNVTLNPSDAHIGSVSIFGSDLANTGMTTLFPGPNFIGLTTTVIGSSPTLYAVVNTGAVGNTNSLATLLAGPNSIGSVTLNNSNANIGSVSILGGVVSMSNFVSPNIGNVMLNSSSANIGSVSILGGAVSMSNFVAPNIGNVTLNASSAHVGSVSIFGTITTGQTTLFPSPNFIGLTTTVICSAPTLYAVVNTGAVGNTNSLATLLAGPNQIGSVTISNWVSPNTGNVTLNASNANIGSVSILGGVVSMSNFVSPNVGNVTLNAGNANIGSVSILGGTIAVSNFANVTLNASSANIGLVSILGGAISMSNFVAPNTGNVSLNASNANIGSVSILGGVVNSIVSLAPSSSFIGLVTTVPTYVSGYTLSAFIISAAGPATLVVPPTGQKIFVKEMVIGSLGRNEIGLFKANSSATLELRPLIGLATTGGYESFFGDNGSEWGIANDAMTAVLTGAATVSIGLNMR